MAPKYGDFKFTADQGFTCSAGKTMVRGYARGGAVKRHPDAAEDRKLIAAELKKRGLKRGGRVC